MNKIVKAFVIGLGLLTAGYSVLAGSADLEGLTHADTSIVYYVSVTNIARIVVTGNTARVGLHLMSAGGSNTTVFGMSSAVSASSNWFPLAQAVVPGTGGGSITFGAGSANGVVPLASIYGVCTGSAAGPVSIQVTEHLKVR